MPPVSVFVVSPEPPFSLLAGPLAPQAQRRQYALSTWQSGELTVAASEISDVTWLSVGMCWLVLSERGQPPWAGFVAPGDLPYQASTVTVRLVGPGEALLGAAAAPRLAAGRRAVRQVVLEALLGSQVLGVSPGTLSSSASVEVNSEMETVQQFIESVAERSGSDWLEETTFDGDRVGFRLHVGEIVHERQLVIGGEEIQSGVIRSRPVVDQVEVQARATGAVSTAERPEPTASRVRSFAIGPAASRVLRLVEHRASGFVAEQATAKYLSAARAAQEIAATLDLTSSGVQALRVGDLVRLQVADWLNGKAVDELVHVHSLEPHEEVDEMEAIFHLGVHGAGS